MAHKFDRYLGYQVPNPHSRISISRGELESIGTKHGRFGRGRLRDGKLFIVSLQVPSVDYRIVAGNYQVFTIRRDIGRPDCAVHALQRL
jgi:hypothetical protein